LAVTSIAIIDYRLDTKQRSGKSATYKGSSLAAALREREKDRAIPIVLLSRGTILRQRRYKSAHDMIGAYDELLLKEQILEDKKRSASLLISLVLGFERLNLVEKNDWESLLKVLDAEKEESADLLRTGPPRDKGQLVWRVPEAARWIRHIILEYPGILYDSLHAAAVLGIKEEDFLSKSVQKVFDSSRYFGAFSDYYPRWWRQRLLRIAFSIMDSADRLGDPAIEFDKAWKEIKKSKLRPSKCVYSKKPHADCVCYVLNKPVLREYSLPYISDNRPDVMDEARLSFKAIIETNDYDERFIREDARPLVKPIQKGEMKV